MPIKIENSTKYGVTEGQLVKTGLNLGTSAGDVDTTLNLPAESIVDYVYIKPTSAAVIANFGTGDRMWISNIKVVVSGVGTMQLLNTDLANTSNFLNNTRGIVIHAGTGPGENAAAGLSDSTADIHLEVSVAGTVNTQPTVDVMVGYRTFDTS